MNFQIGERVRLKSGGPEMTVEHVEDDDVRCYWTADGQTMTNTFLSDTLDSIDPRYHAEFISDR